MNWAAFLISFVLFGWLSGVSAVTCHLFWDRPVVSRSAFFVSLASFALALPVSVWVGFTFGGN